MKKKGFTLIELVVVMAIIAILSLLIIAAIAAARRQADLTAVTGDSKTYEIALESYSAKNAGKYPITTTATKVNTATTGLGTVLAPYLSTTPSSVSIWYISDSTGARYTLVGCPSDKTGIGTIVAGTMPTDPICTTPTPAADAAYKAVR
jgi:prepilin-type N-terminal cleavage/methylation domain-containing protein